MCLAPYPWIRKPTGLHDCGANTKEENACGLRIFATRELFATVREWGGSYGSAPYCTVIYHFTIGELRPPDKWPELYLDRSKLAWVEWSLKVSENRAVNGCTGRCGDPCQGTRDSWWRALHPDCPTGKISLEVVSFGVGRFLSCPIVCNNETPYYSYLL